MMPASIVAEALRVNDRYLHEIVIPFGFCPWAEHTLRADRVARQVLLDESPPPEAALPFIDQLEASGGDAVVGFLILPCVALAAGEFDRYTERVRQADRARRAPGTLPAFVLAAFHPQPATAEFKTPHQLVSFIRRTPDPTIQLVREATLADARRAAPDVSEQIAGQNWRTVTTHGRAHIETIFDDIRRDRDQAYARAYASVSP